MTARRRVNHVQGQAALQAWRTGGRDRTVLATAVRYALEELAARAPGHAVEVRVPPYGVAQCGEGPRHTRGTPPNVVETDAQTWLSLATGDLSWARVVDQGLVVASGTRTDLSPWLPLWSEST